MINRQDGPDSPAKQLSEQILDKVLSDGLEQGQFFMTEQQISELFGVSRRRTREAVNGLRALGFLESRRRKGLMMGDADPVELLSKTLPFFGRTKKNLRELARLRYTLEIGSLDLGVAHATESQLDRLELLAEEFQRVAREPSSQKKELLAVEYSFHRLILEATGSSFISEMHGTVLDFFRLDVNARPEFPESVDRTAWQHIAIATAYRKRDVEQVRALLRLHLAQLIEIE